jgi:ankyrin repeat protein
MILFPVKKKNQFKKIESFVSLDTRSSFPTPGPLENASLNLFEFSYHGQEKNVHDLLMKRFVYVDVCDSHGLTALHFATYNGHINVINTLLDFGANVNQLSDDGITPLSLAFLLYYGNNPQETINLALEHTDPIILNPRIPSSLTRTNSIILSKQNLTHSSGYFTNDSSIIDEMKIPSSFELMKINDLNKKSKKIICFFN